MCDNRASRLYKFWCVNKIKANKQTGIITNSLHHLLFCYHRSIFVASIYVEDFGKQLILPVIVSCFDYFRYFLQLKLKKRKKRRGKSEDSSQRISHVDWVSATKIFRHNTQHHNTRFRSLALSIHSPDTNRYQFIELDCSFIDFITSFYYYFISFNRIGVTLYTYGFFFLVVLRSFVALVYVVLCFADEKRTKRRKTIITSRRSSRSGVFAQFAR